MRRFLLSFLISLTLAGCSTRELRQEITPTFSSIQQVTLGPKCVSCHSSLSTYSGVLQIVRPGDAPGSELYEVISDGHMPRQSPKLSDEEIQAVYQWIESGAAND